MQKTQPTHPIPPKTFDMRHQFPDSARTPSWSSDLITPLSLSFHSASSLPSKSKRWKIKIKNAIHVIFLSEAKTVINTRSYKHQSYWVIINVRLLWFFQIAHYQTETTLKKNTIHTEDTDEVLSSSSWQPNLQSTSGLNKGFLFGFIGVSVVASPCVHPYKHPVFTQHHTQTRFK